MPKVDRSPNLATASRRRPWLMGGLIAAVTLAAALPPAAVRSGPTLCPFRLITGLPCPTCGLTRSWAATAHGQFADAFALHPLGPVSFAAAVVVVGLFVARRSLPSGWIVRLGWVAAVVVLLGWGLTRMVLVARGSWSGPY